MTTEPEFILALLLGAAAGAANVAGGLLIVSRHWSREYLKYFIALGAGFMLGVAFLEMIPVSLKMAGEISLVIVLAGYFLVHFFEHTLAPHFHFGEETHAEELVPPQAGYAAVAGLALHSVFDGVAIASGFLVSTWLGMVIFLAVFLHKLPEGFTVASLMLAIGRSGRAALAASAVVGSATLLGVILMLLFRARVDYALPLAAGVTIYVAATDLMPEVNREPGIKMAVWVFIGLAIMAVMHFTLHAH